MKYPPNIIRRADMVLTERVEKNRENFSESREAAYATESGHRLRAISEEIIALTTRLVSIAAKKGDNRVEAIDEVKAKADALKAEQWELLIKEGLPADYLEMKYHCSKCKDTGEHNNAPCSCYIEILNRLVYENSPLGEHLRKLTFENFSLDYYSDAKGAKGVSHRYMMEKNLEIAKSFVSGFESDTKKSLLFIGETGLGKSHLAAAVGGELSKRGFSVIYDMASVIFENFEAYRFGRRFETNPDAYLECDLLIIDDLGSEFTTAMSTSALFNIINHRLLHNKKTIITTNMDFAALEQQYTKKINSRLMGEYMVLFFEGKDIREQKRKNKK